MTVCQKPTIRKFSNKPFTSISYDLILIDLVSKNILLNLFNYYTEIFMTVGITY